RMPSQPALHPTDTAAGGDGGAQPRAARGVQDGDDAGQQLLPLAVRPVLLLDLRQQGFAFRRRGLACEIAEMPVGIEAVRRAERVLPQLERQLVTVTLVRAAPSLEERRLGAEHEPVE